MAPLFSLVFFALFQPAFSSFYTPNQVREYQKNCPPFSCGNLSGDQIQTPYRSGKTPDYCGPFVVDGCDEPHQRIKLEKEGKWYAVESISQGNTISIRDNELQKSLKSNSCQSFNNLTLPNHLLYATFHITSFNLTMLKCEKHTSSFSSQLELLNYTGCKDFNIYYPSHNQTLPSTTPPNCSIIQLPVFGALLLEENAHGTTMDRSNASGQIKVLYQTVFSPPVSVCWGCLFHFYFLNESVGGRRLRLKLLGVGLGVGISATMMILLLIYCIHKRRYASSNLLSATPSKNSDIEESSVYFGVPVFSYTELEEASNYFNPESELGDGGFGTVYYGKLRDGREVAIKRLYEHNFKRVKQFINEIEILTLLRHKNLVLLYGCTSRRSRDLLLVYEYIPNGTVADHLHGDLAKLNPLAWQIRMKIAIETASALAYLHASEIVHRDVKTNNILLDNNFCVKVADFGLSRLFPNDVTHVSTAPQGTPGYVDPEYYHCYQLTDKSDVYSFGVVLIELISSMPAVDITRHRHEINLASLAMSKIHQSAFDELIDSCLGYNSDDEVKRMTTSVAELAFLCLQQEKEMRPSMNEVLEGLRGIESGCYKFEHSQVENNGGKAEKSTGTASPKPDCSAPLLKNIQPQSSPDYSTDQLFSSSSSN